MLLAKKKWRFKISNKYFCVWLSSDLSRC